MQHQYKTYVVILCPENSDTDVIWLLSGTTITTQIVDMDDMPGNIRKDVDLIIEITVSIVKEHLVKAK